jgi:N-acetylmuramic acid 6-phosphate etherase
VTDGYADLPTERIDPEGPALDRLPPGEIARLLLEEEHGAREAVASVLPAVERACAAAAEALAQGGRLVYAGAGTSGRLGVLDAAEMGPTFGAEPDSVVALLAGAPEALTRSVEGAEDDADQGHADLAALRPGREDCVVGVSMSGTAAYVAGVLNAAHAAGARRVLLTAHGGSRIAADIRIPLDLGPELLAGSTRLKAGSATKIVLNMISTAAMCATGAVYGNLMVRVRPTNRKLRARAEALVARLTGADATAAATLLREADDDVGVAVVMARRGLGRREARALIEAAGGRLREVLS